MLETLRFGRESGGACHGFEGNEDCAILTKSGLVICRHSITDYVDVVRVHRPFPNLSCIFVRVLCIHYVFYNMELFVCLPLLEIFRYSGWISCIVRKPGPRAVLLIFRAKHPIFGQKEKTYLIYSCYRQYYSAGYLFAHPINQLLRQNLFVDGFKSQQQGCPRISSIENQHENFRTTGQLYFVQSPPIIVLLKYGYVI